MKKILIALVAVLFLAGGGAGVYFYFGQSAQAAVGETDEHQKAKETDAGEHGDASGYEFVKLDPLILPIIDNSGVTQVVSIVVMIEVEGSRDAEKVKMLSPRLKDAYIQDMYGVLNKHAALSGGVIKVDVIKNRLNHISKKVLGDGVVHDVLLQVVQQRPI